MLNVQSAAPTERRYQTSRTPAVPVDTAFALSLDQKRRYGRPRRLRAACNGTCERVK